MACTVTAELNGIYIYGGDIDADYLLTADSITGIGVPDVNPGDLNIADEHGSVTGVDYAAPRILRLPVSIFREDEPQLAMEAFRDLATAWRVASDTQTLSVTIPGLGPADDTLRYYGRPRGSLQPRLQGYYAGYVRTLATFEALDPVGYGPEETTAGSGTFVVTNSGDVDSRRAVVTVTGATSALKLENADDDGAFVEFSAASGTVVIDLYAKTVVNGSGTDIYASSGVLNTSTWPRLVPGTNSLTLSNATSASVAHHDAWW